MPEHGTIDRDWLIDARMNESDDDTIEDAICEWGNLQQAEIQDDGSVWVVLSADANRWLYQMDIDVFCTWLDGRER